MREDRIVRENEIRRMLGKKRVWFVFGMDHERMERIFRLLLDPHGIQMDCFRGNGSTVLLYDLRRPIRF